VAENIHPHCPSVLIEDRVDIPESVLERVQKVMIYNTIHFPLTESPTQAQAISAHVFHWNINTYVFEITVKHDTYTWLSKLLSHIRPWIRRLNFLIGIIFRYSDFRAAKMVMRWIVRFGECILGRRPEDPWMTPKILILFWLTDFLVLKTLRISKLDWVFGLWSCNSETRRRSLWFVSGKDLLTVLALQVIGGLLVGLSQVTGEEGI
jgi:hypothetical protein